MDELQMVRELFAEPASPSPRVIAAARARLTSGQGRRPRPALRVGLPLVATAAVVTVVVTVVAAPTPGAPVPPSVSSPTRGLDVFQLPSGAVRTAAETGTGRQTLLTAAMTVARSTQLTSGRYWDEPAVVGNFLRVGPSGDPYVILEKVAIQQWTPQSKTLPGPSIEQPLSVQFASAADASAWRADGSPTTWTNIGQDESLASPQGYTSGLMRPITAGPGSPATSEVQFGSAGFYVFGRTMSARQLLALPSDPATLKALLVAQYKDDQAPGGFDSYLLSAVPALLTIPVTPAVRSALYQVLAGLPGVRSLGRTQDVAGQWGVAVAVDSHWSKCGYELALDAGNGMKPTFSSCDVQQILIINPATGLPIASELRYTSLPSGQTWSAPDGLFSYELFGTAGWTNANPPVR